MLLPNDVVAALERRIGLSQPVRDWLLTTVSNFYLEAVEEGREQLRDELRKLLGQTPREG